MAANCMLDRCLQTIDAPEHIFRQYDIRGQAGSEITAQLAYALGRVFPSFCPQPQQPIAVGYDARLSSPALFSALRQGLLDAGATIFELGLCATPLVYFSAFHCSLAGCIQVTASHNPATDNGFKMMCGQQSLYGQALQRIRHQLKLGLPPSTQKGTVTPLPLLPDYLARCREDCRLSRPLTVVVDAGNGPAGLMAVPLYQAIGCQVIDLYCEPDGNFPNHHPDPTREENLLDLIAAVQQHQADLGIAFDGDGDRIGVVDEKGNVIVNDMLLLLLARALLKEHPGAYIISESKSSNRLYEGIRSAGGTPLMSMTGHALIKAKMHETGALLGGELTGHIFYADRYFGYDDAIYVGARLLQVLADSHVPLSLQLADVPPIYNTAEIRIPCSDQLKFAIEQEAQHWFAAQGYQVSLLDGLRITLDDGSWGLLRASHTQAMLITRFEANSPSALQNIQQIIESWLQQRMKIANEQKSSNLNSYPVSITGAE